MNLRKTFTALLAFTTIMLLTACESENKADVTPPVIDLIEPEEGENFTPGTDIHFEMDLTDDVMLASYKIEVHNNFNNHGHSTARRAAATGTPFSFNRSYDVSGQRNAHIHHHDIMIPANAATGQYHLMVYCTDAAGNEAHVARTIHIVESNNSTD
ncbi:MAG: DUF4625 domain-containing protein [Paludibacteraceae bacterium]|nr:DUF4625 domain-containing protein [Paludibacteraceae bacterium]